MAEQEAASEQSPEAGEANFLSMVNLLAMQAVVALGGMQTPDGQRMQPDPQAARIYIDLLGILDQKTKGNLTDDESKILTQTLGELRMMFVQLVGPGAGAGANAGGGDAAGADQPE